MKMKKIPLRQCIGCGTIKSKKEMLRIVKTGTGEILLDPSGRVNGRGAYTCIDKVCLLNAQRNKGLERSFKVKIEAKVYERLLEEFDAS